MTLTRDDVYPELVAYFYANASRGLHSDDIKSYVKGVSIILDRNKHVTLGIKTSASFYLHNFDPQDWKI